jgi:hypothetical protein
MEQTVTKGRPPGIKNKLDSWKNTATPAWKPLANLQIEVNPDSITYRSRLQYQHYALAQDNADLVHAIWVHSKCRTEDQQKGSDSPRSIQENWSLRNRCPFSPHPNYSKPPGRP